MQGFLACKGVPSVEEIFFSPEIFPAKDLQGRQVRKPATLYGEPSVDDAGMMLGSERGHSCPLWFFQTADRSVRAPFNLNPMLRVLS